MANKYNIKNGLKSDTVKNMVFGTGVLYRNFKYGTHYTETFDKQPSDNKEYYYITGGSSGGIGYTKFEGEQFDGSTKYYEKYEGFGGEKIGATKEGTKVSIIPEYTDIEVDGVLVKTEGLTRKTGEKATMEAIVIDMSSVNIATAVNGNIEYSEDDIIGGGSGQYIKTKSDITAGDYIENLALAARRLDNQKLTVIVFKKALCTSGFELDMKNKNAVGNKYVFEAYADMSDIENDTLPIVIMNESNI